MIKMTLECAAIARVGLLLAAVLAIAGCADDADMADAVTVGDAMPSLAWEGYVNEEADGLSTNKPFRDYGTAALAASGRRYALLHTSESF